MLKTSCGLPGLVFSNVYFWFIWSSSENNISLFWGSVSEVFVFFVVIILFFNWYMGTDKG